MTSDQDCDRQERDLLAYFERADQAVAAVSRRPLGIRKARGKQPVERKKAMDLPSAEIECGAGNRMTRWGVRRRI